MPPSWQAQAPKVAAQVGIENLTLLNPRKTERFVTGTYQANWETFGLRMCDVILFWIPPQARPMKPWRYYAITTRLEMAENLARGHKVIIGIDSEFKNENGDSEIDIQRNVILSLSRDVALFQSSVRSPDSVQRKC